MVWRLRREHGLKTRYERLREKGMLTLGGIAAQLDLAYGTAKVWKGAGYLCGHLYNDRGQCLFEPPGPHAPLKYKQKRRVSINRVSSTAS